MVKIGKTIIIILIAVMLMASVVHGNSAITHFNGSDTSGIYSKDCPLEVKGEKLTFYLLDEPLSHYPSNEAFLNYANHVEAQYQIYNPSEETLTVSFAFPFGQYPYYRPDNIGNKDVEKYHIYVDGEPVTAKLRYTYANYNGPTETDFAVLNNADIEYPFYRKDMDIAVYTFNIENIETHDGYTWLNLEGEVPENCKLLFTNGDFISCHDNKIITKGIIRDKAPVLYVFNNMDYLPEYSLIDENDKEVKGDINVEKTVIKFSEYVRQNYKESYDISSYDFYHGFVNHLTHLENGNYLLEPAEFKPAYSMMRWYQYEITFEPGQTRINTVEAPMYPTIDEKYRPSLFSYTYLLTPAKTFKKFGPLEINIETSLELLKCPFAYEKVDNGYHVSLDTLPDQELTFDLCQSAHPARQTSSYLTLILLFLIPILILFILIIILIIRLFRKRKNRR